MCMFLLGTGGPQMAHVLPIPIEPYTSTHAHYTLTQHLPYSYQKRPNYLAFDSDSFVIYIGI